MEETSSLKEEKEPKNKPNDCKFCQQKLPAWQPILTANAVIPGFIIIGLCCIAIGVVLLVASSRVYEKAIDYTNCNSTKNSTILCKDIIGESHGKQRCTCRVSVNIEKDIESKYGIFFYYGLKNYHQNLRRYIQSYCTAVRQFMGDLDDVHFTNCKNSLFFKKSQYEELLGPYVHNSTGTLIAPCGELANSFFNDTFRLYSGDNKLVPWTDREISWHHRNRVTARNPGQNISHYPTVDELKASFQNFAPPVSWGKKIWELDPEHADNNGLINRDFINWIHYSGFPDFRKLYRIYDFYKLIMKKGNYTLEIDYHYPVVSYSGRKSFIISSTSWAGAKNSFLGIAYVVVGTVCFLTGMAFLFIHLKFGKSLAEISSVRPDPSMTFDSRMSVVVPDPNLNQTNTGLNDIQTMNNGVVFRAHPAEMFF